MFVCRNYVHFTASVVIRKQCLKWESNNGNDIYNVILTTETDGSNPHKMARYNRESNKIPWKWLGLVFDITDASGHETLPLSSEHHWMDSSSFSVRWLTSAFTENSTHITRYTWMAVESQFWRGMWMTYLAPVFGQTKSHVDATTGPGVRWGRPMGMGPMTIIQLTTSGMDWLPHTPARFTLTGQQTCLATKPRTYTLINPLFCHSRNTDNV